MTSTQNRNVCIMALQAKVPLQWLKFLKVIELLLTRQYWRYAYLREIGSILQADSSVSRNSISGREAFATPGGRQVHT